MSMRPELAYALGALTVIVSQILFEVSRGLVTRCRARKHGPVHQRAVAAVQAGHVAEISQTFDGSGRETVIRIVEPSRGDSRR
jgi:hypothetical protein